MVSKLINADANGVLNILRKYLGLSLAFDLKMIQRISGCLIRPKGIRSFGFFDFCVSFVLELSISTQYKDLLQKSKFDAKDFALKRIS